MKRYLVTLALVLVMGLILFPVEGEAKMGCDMGPGMMGGGMMGPGMGSGMMDGGIWEDGPHGNAPSMGKPFLYSKRSIRVN